MDGLCLIVDYPDVKYFFGKVTMYRHFDAFARDLILYFMKLYFPDPDKLVYPHDPLSNKTDANRIDKVLKEMIMPGIIKYWCSRCESRVKIFHRL